MDASLELKENFDISLAAVQQNGLAIEHVWEELKNNPAIVLAAVQNNWHALKYASDEQKNNRSIVQAAVQQNWRALQFASKELQEDPEFSQFVQQKKEELFRKDTRVLNFMWLNLDLPAKPDPEDGSIRMPLPEEYIESVREAGKRHSGTDIHLWFDSRRITQRQWDYLEAVVEDGLPNVHLKDLCSIPAYANEELYSRAETHQDWRVGYQGVIWLQIDAAKILISLQGDYDEHFFADLDHAHIDLESDRVRERISKHGLMIGSPSAEDDYGIENQLWGFNRSRLNFFEEYYADGLKMSYRGRIAYEGLVSKVNCDLGVIENIPTNEICIPIGSIGLAHAEEPGHEWSGYKGRVIVSGDEIQAVFNTRSERKRLAVKTAPSAPAVISHKLSV